MNFNQYVTDNSLNLKNRKINIRELISFLQSNSNITELNVENCNIDYEGVKELAKLTNLTSLDLAWNIVWNIVRSRPYDEGVKELAKLTNLTSLDLAWNIVWNIVRSRPYDEGAKELAKFTNLTSLNLAHNNIDDKGVKELAKLTNLTSLDLAWNIVWNIVRSRPYDEGAKELAKFTNLTSLNLAHNNIDDKGAKELAKFTNLTSLDLSWNKVGAEGIKELAKLTNLTSLNLECNEIDAEGAKELAKLTNLTSLNLVGNNIGAEGAKELAKLTNLTSLDLLWNNIGAEGAKELAKLTNLTSLNLIGNKIDAEGIKELAKLTNLTSLNLAHNKIDAEGIKELAKLTNLTSLNLAHNNIDDEGTKELAKLTNLTSLDLLWNNIGAEGAKELAKLTNLTSLNLIGNNIGAKGEKVLAESGKDVQGLKDFYENLKKAWLKNSHASELNEDATKELFFNLASKRKIEEVRLLLDDPDKYPFLVNSKGSEGRALPYFYAHSPEMQRFLFELLFERGMIPERDDRRIAQDDQSIHISSTAKRINFFIKKLVKSIKVGEEQLKQAAASYVESIELLKQYQNDPIRLMLLSLTDNEKRSVMEETLSSGSSIPNDKEFIKAVIDKAEQVLVDTYLKKNEQSEYDGIYSTSRMQYDYSSDDAKVTIPESIGYIKLLIDNFPIPLKEKKELLVTLAEQNPELVKQKLSSIKSELENDNISQEQITNRAEFHKLLDNVNDDKVNKLFEEIGGFNIEKTWREQKELVLLKQIYIAATTYGDNSSACIPGTWSQIISSINEISSEILIQCNHYLEEEQKLEAKKDIIIKENIKPFLEDLANELIQYVELHQELKETLKDFFVWVVDIDNPEKITFKQQKILAEINKYFSKNIKDFLQGYNRNIPNRDEYNLITAGLLEVGIMQHFAQPNQELFNLHTEKIAIQIGK